MSTYEDKYIKYKNKYLELKYGGSRKSKKYKTPTFFVKGTNINSVRRQIDTKVAIEREEKKIEEQKRAKQKREEQKREKQELDKMMRMDIMKMERMEMERMRRGRMITMLMGRMRIDSNMQSIQDPRGKWIKVNKKLVKYSQEEGKHIPDGKWIEDENNNYIIQRSTESKIKEIEKLKEQLKIYEKKIKEKIEITSNIQKYKVDVKQIIEGINKFSNDNKTNLNLYLIGEDHMLNIMDGIEKQKLIIKNIETILNKKPLIYHELPESLKHVLSESKENPCTVCEAVLPFLRKEQYNIELTKTERTDTIDSPIEEQNNIYIDEIKKHFSPSNKNIIAILGLAHIKYIYDILNNSNLDFGVIKVHMINTVSEEILVKCIIDEKSRSKTIILDTLKVAPYF